MSNTQPTQKKWKTWHKVFLGFVAVFLILIIIGRSNIKDVPKTQMQKDASTAKENEPKTSWQYTESTDKMDNKKSVYAVNLSPTKIDFEFPYDGGSTFTLTIRKTGADKNVILTVSKGQFIGNVMGERGVRIKFDQEKPVVYGFSESSDGRNDVIFIQNETKLIQKIKTAKMMVIEAEFFQEGRKQIDFDVSNLKWD